MAADSSTPSNAAGSDLEATHITDPAGAQTRVDAASTQADAESRPTGKPAPKPPAGSSEPLGKMGDFQIDRKLGQGGMGVVYLAHQISLDRKVALKVLSKELSAKPSFVERFVREARTMARLDHPNIVRGYAVGEQDGQHYVAMELIDGKSMQDWLVKLGKLSVGDAVHVTLKAADALQHAHEINLIHRDIKPDNMLVTGKGVLKVSDLGLAKDVGEDQGMTQSGVGLGTPYYMPPEQARNAKHVDARCDIYALGSTLYHFLTGAYPYTANSTVELLLAKETKSYTAAHKLNPSVPERLSLVIDKMMARDPKHRYQTCTDVMRDLERLNLANPTLSFIAGAVPPRESAAAKAPPTTPMTPARAEAPAAPTTARPRKAAGDQIWHIKHTRSDGRLTISKMPTEKVLQVLKTGHLDHRSKASKTGKDDYQPLAAFPEFETAVQQQIVRAKTEKTAGKFDDLYKKIESDELRRRRWGWISRSFESVKGFVSLLIWLAILGGIGFGGYWLVMTIIWPMIAAKYNLK